LEGQVGEIATLSKLCQDLRSDVNTARKQMILSSFGSPGQLAPGQVVSEGCAHYLAGVLIQCALAQGKLDGHKQRDQLLEFSASAVRIVGKTAITTSDIPVPTEFGKEIVALVWKYGQFRQYARVYPLGASPTKLPKLKTSPAFGVIAQSAAVTEKSPQTEYVTFTPFKSGGLLRIPSEIDADTLGALGQFLAEYVSREAARWEDVVGFTGDGTSTYGSVSGVCKHADTQSKLVQLGAGMTSPADITLADLRLLRTKVDQAALMDSAYYMSMTMEAHLTSYNISANVTPYIANSLLGSRLDGFPIRWVGVMPSFDTGAHAGQYQVAFGNLQYWFLGERAGWDIQTSRDVFFATDEIAMRALNRMDIHAMADAAMAVLKLAS
jgi:HK97 family phage major capsid protein